MCKYCEPKRCELDACNLVQVEKFRIEKNTIPDYLSITTHITPPTPIALKKREKEFLAKLFIHYECGYTTVSMDIPVRYCPFCGRDLHESTPSV